MNISRFLLGIAAVTIVTCSVPTAPAFAGGTPPALRRSAAGERVVIPPPQRGLNRYQQRLVERYLSGSAAAIDDTLHVIAFQVQFADTAMGGLPGGRPEPRDSTWFANELRHTKEYFDGASRGRLTVDFTLDGTLYTLPEGMGYYGRDTFEDQRVVELAGTLVGMADPTIDFSRYDHVFIIHAGAGQETDLAGDSRVQIWSSFYDVSDIDAAYPDTTVSGLATDDSLGGEPFVVDNFSIVPANASQDYTYIGTLGIWAFEVASRVGLLPMFDSTPAAAPDGQGVGSFGIMAYGLFNATGYIPGFPCAFNRLLAGWLDPVTVEPSATPRSLRLSDVNTGADADTVCAKIPITENEYYLVVNRVHDANFDSLFTFVDVDSNLIPDNTDSLEGADFDYFLSDITSPYVVRYLPAYGRNVTLVHTGSGVYIWHVDEDVIRETTAAGYLPNDFVERKGVDLEEADGVQDMDSGGSAAFALGSYYDSYRAGDGNQTAFGPDTKPASDSNAGIRTGIVVDNISVPGHMMTCRVRLEADYADHRVRFNASALGQPPTVFDLDGDGNAEIAVLTDSARVYLFDGNGAEYNDADADPATIAPFDQAAGEWAGPGAAGDLDGVTGEELVAGTREGAVYRWDSGAAQLLYTAPGLAAGPMLADVEGTAEPEIVLVESDGDSLRLRLVDAQGNPFSPSDGAFTALWPYALAGQYAAPPGWAGTGPDRSPAKEGVVVAWVDTVAARFGVTYVPARHTAGPLTSEPVAATWTASYPLPAGIAGVDPVGFVSAPAVGDIDADGSDEVVLTTADGRLFIFENDAGETGVVDPEVVRLRGAHPSAPALGDTDLDGTLEIALWDDEYLYLLESNGRPVTEWPKLVVPASVGELPPSTPRRGLESPVIADLDGDGTIEVAFLLEDGSLRAYHHNGAAADGFPRVGPAAALAAPTVAALGGPTAHALVSVGSIGRLSGVNTVVDSFTTVDETTLSVQTLPGSRAGDRIFWGACRAASDRRGRVVESAPLRSAAGTVESGSFMIYPSPVHGDHVNVRVTLNTRARVHLRVFNLEGEETLSRSYEANSNGLIGTPFDESVDVRALVSGVYFVHLEIDGDGGSDTMIKPFAIRR